MDANLNHALNLLNKAMVVAELAINKKSIEDYGRRLRGLTRGLWNGEIDKFGFVDSMSDAIERGFNQAWTEGARSCGIEPSERTQDEEAKLQEMINGQLQYLPGLADYIMAHSKFWLEGGIVIESTEEPPMGETIEEQMLAEDIGYGATDDTSLGGVNESYRVGIGDEEAIIKPGANVWDKEIDAEAFTYRMSNELGFDIVPPTVKREAGTYRLPDGSVSNVDASIQQWVKNGTLGKDVNFSDLDQRSYTQMVLMDSLTNNRDRHLSNWMIVDNKVVAIDNGLGFRNMTTNLFHHSTFDDGLYTWSRKTRFEKPLKFNASDIDAITDLVSNKNFERSFIDTFGQDKWTSFEYQAKVIKKNKNALINGIDSEFMLEDL